jgi:hypothetical protein
MPASASVSTQRKPSTHATAQSSPHSDTRMSTLHCPLHGHTSGSPVVLEPSPVPASLEGNDVELGLLVRGGGSSVASSPQPIMRTAKATVPSILLIIRQTVP